MDIFKKALLLIFKIVAVLFLVAFCLERFVAPYFVGSHRSPKGWCINNLRQLDGAKQQWALENHKDTNAVPTSADVAQYLKNNKFPVCPEGGKYTIGRVDADPTCSIPSHVLPPL